MPIAVGVLQLLVHCFSQIFQSKGDRIYTLDYHKGALGSYICNKTLGGQEGGAALHFQGKATNREKFDFTFMFIWEKNSTHSFVLN